MWKNRVTDLLTGVGLVIGFCFASSMLMVFGGVLVCELFGGELPGWYRTTAFRLAITAMVLLFILLTGGTVVGLAALVVK
jgi:hypothetical protein